MAKFCPNCGSKIYDEKKFCSDCGCEVDADVIKTPINYKQTNTNINNFNYQPKSIDRTLETILGLIGGIIGLLIGIYYFYIGIFFYNISSYYNFIINSLSKYSFQGLGALFPLSSTLCIIFATITLIAAIIAICSSIFIKKNPKLFGVLLIISSIGFIAGLLWFSYIPVVLTFIAGILAITRK